MMLNKLRNRLLLLLLLLVLLAAGVAAAVVVVVAVVVVAAAVQQYVAYRSLEFAIVEAAPLALVRAAHAVLADCLTKCQALAD